MQFSLLHTAIKNPVSEYLDECSIEHQNFLFRPC